ncbi:unnamed protein product, partial [Meganyctiphanes norvegica]
TSRSTSMCSWSACDSLGFTDTAAMSKTTNVTGYIELWAASQSSHVPSCRALVGSLASFDTSNLVNNEGPWPAGYEKACSPPSVADYTTMAGHLYYTQNK